MEDIIRVDCIKKYMIIHLLTIKEFCKKCGIKVGDFKKIMNNKTNFKFTVLCKISKCMAIDIYELFEKKVIEYPLDYTYKL